MHLFLYFVSAELNLNISNFVLFLLFSEMTRFGISLAVRKWILFVSRLQEYEKDKWRFSCWTFSISIYNIRTLGSADPSLLVRFSLHSQLKIKIISKQGLNHKTKSKAWCNVKIIKNNRYDPSHEYDVTTFYGQADGQSDRVTNCRKKGH